MLPAELVEKWKKLLGLRAWKITLRPDLEPPEPARLAAATEYVYPSKEAAIWAGTEAEVIHELLHVLLSGLEHVIWQMNPDKSRRALWNRREEEIVKRLERAFIQAMRNHK